MLRVFATLIALLLPTAVAAQSGCPSIITGAVLTSAQWNACFQAKQDTLGYSPVNRNGDTMLGRLITAAPGANVAGFNLTPGSTPGLPANGDLWATSTDAFVRVGGVTKWLTAPNGRLFFTKNINFNATGDNTIPLGLPPGFTRYRVISLMISNATHTLTTATAGLFTAASGGGVAIVTDASSITVANTTDATNNNSQSMTINNSGTKTYTLVGQPNLYFRIGTGEGATATGDVTVQIEPLP